MTYQHAAAKSKGWIGAGLTALALAAVHFLIGVPIALVFGTWIAISFALGFYYGRLAHDLEALERESPWSVSFGRQEPAPEAEAS